MSDMKCPICNSYLHKIPVKEAWVCSIHDSKDDLYGSKELWQELIRTRKALDVAKYAIKNIQDDMKKVKDGDDIWEIQKNLHDYCKTTLKQIKAQEQKDVK